MWKKIGWRKCQKIFLEAVFPAFKKLFSKFLYKMFVIICVGNQVPFCLCELNVGVVNHFQFHCFALNFTSLHWFGINWHDLNQTECRNCCLYIIILHIIDLENFPLSQSYKLSQECKSSITHISYLHKIM